MANRQKARIISGQRVRTPKRRAHDGPAAPTLHQKLNRRAQKAKYMANRRNEEKERFDLMNARSADEAAAFAQKRYCLMISVTNSYQVEGS